MVHLHLSILYFVALFNSIKCFCIIHGNPTLHPSLAEARLFFALGYLLSECVPFY